jgi:hypothetical protein
MESSSHHIEVVPRIQDSKLAAIYTPKKSKQTHKSYKEESIASDNEYEYDDEYIGEEDIPYKKHLPSNNHTLSSPPTQQTTFTSRFFKSFNDYFWPVMFIIVLIVIIYIVYIYVTKYRNKTTENDITKSNSLHQSHYNTLQHKTTIPKATKSEAEKYIMDNDTMSDTASISDKYTSNKKGGVSKNDLSDNDTDEDEDGEEDEEYSEEDEEEDEEDDEENDKKNIGDDDDIYDLPPLEPISSDDKNINLDKIHQLVDENMDNVIELDDDISFDVSNDIITPTNDKKVANVKKTNKSKPSRVGV